MKQKSKGITPVIAIVLLLLVTIGAVGAVYGQFQDILAQGNTDAEFLDEVPVKINVVTRHEGNSPNTMNVTIENTGEKSINLSKNARLQYQIPGEESLRAVPAGAGFEGFEYDETLNTCFGDELFGPGELMTCGTGFSMPSPDEEITVQLVKEGTENSAIDSYTCSPSTGDSATC
jgi:hypothetical protein